MTKRILSVMAITLLLSGCTTDSTTTFKPQTPSQQPSTDNKAVAENPAPIQETKGLNEEQLKHYSPVSIKLKDYRGANLNLVTAPSDAVLSGVRTLGELVDYPSPPISPTPGYELTLKSPVGQEVVLDYVGHDNWQVIFEDKVAFFIEGKTLADAVEEALPVPSRQPGDLEYLFRATGLRVTQNQGVPDEIWNQRRQVVVRVLRDLGTLKADVSIPKEQPIIVSFHVNGQNETVEVWANAFRYGGKIFQAEQILLTLRGIMSAG